MPPPRELPTHNELFWPVVRALRQLDGSSDNEQLLEKVVEILGVTDELAAILHKSGPQTELGYRIAWVKSWLKWGEIVDNPQRGIWVLTKQGRSANEEEINEVPRRRRAEKSSKQKGMPDEPLQAVEDIDQAPPSDELEEFGDDGWRNVLLDVIKGMEASAFERLARLLLLRLGFSHVDLVGRSGDGGIDLIGSVRLNNVLSFRVLAQCKRYKDTVGPGDIRNFRGAMQGRTDKGIFITSGRYTREARNEASRDGVPAIDLVDGEAFTTLLKDMNMGVETRMVERVIVNPEFFDGI